MLAETPAAARQAAAPPGDPPRARRRRQRRVLRDRLRLLPRADSRGFARSSTTTASGNASPATSGYHDGEPVSTAAIVVGGGAIGVYNVATLPGSQRRGFGEAVMRHALAEARKRHVTERLILQSTPAGLRLYERMGFRTVTRVAVYSS